MSVQFGRYNFDGNPIDPKDLDEARPLLAPYGPDAEGSFCRNNVAIVYRAFHTTKESRNEVQPYVSTSGAVITWDGRLDNRKELVERLGGELSAQSTDIVIVSVARERWGNGCFAKLIGDWALSVWDPRDCSLTLAKDFIGTRHLYYSVDRRGITWSTILDPLLLFAGKTFVLNEEYIAGWFSLWPAAHLTPYVGIHSVPPSSFVLLRPGKQTVSKCWDFDPGKQLRYRSDSEYEEHFRSVFAEAVRRRLRSDCPILAELSGGMDSSSIVCVGDTIIGRGAAETPRLDTLSYYDDSEPNWNERPYFTKVEEKRGRPGHHIDLGSQQLAGAEANDHCFEAVPGSGRGCRSRAAKQIMDRITSQGNRVLLSGMGGDEVMGGVPTPRPELEDLLATGRFRALARQLKAWALNKRAPWFHLLFEAARGFLLPSIIGFSMDEKPAPWLNLAFVARNRAALHGYESRLKLFGPLPSFQENISTLNALRRQLACCALPSIPTCERRYPYLDRDLLEFVYAIPREQLVRPGQRRSLMRRALVGVVPDEILNRKRKAYMVRAPIMAISTAWAGFFETPDHLIPGSLQFIDPSKLREAMQKARQGRETLLIPLLRTITIHSWLKSLTEQGVLARSEDNALQSLNVVAPNLISAEKT